MRQSQLAGRVLAHQVRLETDTDRRTGGRADGRRKIEGRARGKNVRAMVDTKEGQQTPKTQDRRTI